MFLYLVLTYTLCTIFLVVLSGFINHMRKYHKYTSMEARGCTSLEEHKHAFKFSYSMRVSGNSIRLERQLLVEGLDRKRNFTLRQKIKLQRYQGVNSALESTVSGELDEELTTKPTFKFTECTICLGQFVDGDGVKVVPGCSHVFHDNCFNDWVALRWRCPNCNTEIIVEGMEEERVRYNERVAIINGQR